MGSFAPSKDRFRKSFVGKTDFPADFLGTFRCGKTALKRTLPGKPTAREREMGTMKNPI